MARTKIFISHASEDSFLVPLLDKLFEIHGLDSWYATSDLRGGDLFRESISEQLAKSSVLVVLLSRQSLSSTWVTTEISQFRAHNPSSRIIPLVLDDFPRERLGEISPYLTGVHAIACAGSLLDGFTQLFSALGHEFLSRKALANRRLIGDRRRGRDRRTRDVLQRLTVGLIITYTRQTGNAPHGIPALAPGDLAAMWLAVAEELTRYSFVDPRTHMELPLEHVLDAAKQHVRATFDPESPEDVSSVLQRVASFVGHGYVVTMRERRKVPRRGGPAR